MFLNSFLQDWIPSGSWAISISPLEGIVKHDHLQECIHNLHRLRRLILKNLEKRPDPTDSGTLRDIMLGLSKCRREVFGYAACCAGPRYSNVVSVWKTAC